MLISWLTHSRTHKKRWQENTERIFRAATAGKHGEDSFRVGTFETRRSLLQKTRREHSLPENTTYSFRPFRLVRTTTRHSPHHVAIACPPEGEA
jgi:hypothetical protein